MDGGVSTVKLVRLRRSVHILYCTVCHWITVLQMSREASHRIRDIEVRTFCADSRFPGVPFIPPAIGKFEISVCNNNSILNSRALTSDQVSSQWSVVSSGFE